MNIEISNKIQDIKKYKETAKKKQRKTEEHGWRNDK